MVLKDRTNTANYENEEITKSLCCLYEVNSWVAVLEKRGILGRLNQLVMIKLKFCVWRELVEHRIALCAQRMKI